MPFTPFHFGPGAAIKAMLPRRFSFSIFCAAQIMTDVEPGYYLLRHEYPVHRWAHTYVGAVIVGLLTALMWTPLARVFRRQWVSGEARPLQSWASGPGPSWAVAIASALIGTLSHVFLDSIMHTDAHPLRPFSDANSILGLVSLRALHLFCVGCGLVAALYVVLAKSRRG